MPNGNEQLPKEVEIDVNNESVKITPYVLDMQGQPANKPIRFKLDSQDYRFVNDALKAIQVHNNDGQFSGNAHGEGPAKGKVITMTDKCSQKRRYKYSITLEDRNGQQLVIDPYIEN